VVLIRTKDNSIIVLAGASASGKDTISQILKDREDYNFVVSHTTRPVRDGESQENPYWFITKSEFDGLEFIETRVYHTLVDDIPEDWYYGVAKSAIKDDEKYVVVLDVEGTNEFVEYFGDRVIPVFLYVDEDTRRQRSVSRGSHNEQVWVRRLAVDRIVFEGSIVDNIYLKRINSYESEKTYLELINWLNN